ncbi:hypothetical protein Tco_0449429 [Tanacetum coccineum]
MHIRKDPSFFFTKRIRAPQGGELGLMKPLSISSCSCSASSFISDGANLYGARAMGVAPGNFEQWYISSRFPFNLSSSLVAVIFAKNM